MDSTPRLKEFYSNEVEYIKETLNKEIAKTKDETTKIKLQEVSKLVKDLDKKTSIKSDNLVDLLQYHSLLEELTKVNG